MGTNQATQQFYRLPQLKALLGVSSSTIWSWAKQGHFPKPIKLSANVSAWKASDVEVWAQARIEASQGKEA